MQALKGMATGAKYTLAGKEKNYKELKEICLNLFKKNDGFVHERTYEFLSPYWTNIIGYVKKISDSDKKMDNFIKLFEKETGSKYWNPLYDDLINIENEYQLSYQFDLQSTKNNNKNIKKNI